MNSTKKISGLFSILSIFIAAAGGVLLFLAFYSDYDLSIRHFENSSPLAIAAGCTIAAGILVSIAAAILLGRKVRAPRTVDASSASVFVSVFAGCLIIGNMIVYMIFSEGSVTVLDVIVSVLAVLSGAYMILSPLHGIGEKPAVKLLSLAPILWLGFSLITVYRATDTAMNDPFNTYYALALISLLLYFTFSVGAALRPKSRKGLYTFSSYLLLSVGGAVILSRIALSLVQKSAFDVLTTESVMLLALYAYVAIQVLSHDRFSEVIDAEVLVASEEESADATEDSSSEE